MCSSTSCNTHWNALTWISSGSLASRLPKGSLHSSGFGWAAKLLELGWGRGENTAPTVQVEAPHCRVHTTGGPGGIPALKPHPQQKKEIGCTWNKLVLVLIGLCRTLVVPYHSEIMLKYNGFNRRCKNSTKGPRICKYCEKMMFYIWFVNSKFCPVCISSLSKSHLPRWQAGLGLGIGRIGDCQGPPNYLCSWGKWNDHRSSW